jgi:hypothetical protein
MSDKNKRAVASEPEVVSAPMAVDTVSLPKEKLSEVDKLTLDLARQRKQTALAEANTAIAQNNNADLTYKYVILQLYMKYSLTEADAISENGDVLRGGALPPATTPGQ